LSTLLFITLDQNHDFRGNRTSGSDSWVTIKNPAYITKIPPSRPAFIDFPMDNPYLNTLVNTTFSGLKSLFGLLVIDEENNNKLTAEGSNYYQNNKLKINEIMSELQLKFFSKTMGVSTGIYVSGCKQ